MTIYHFNLKASLIRGFYLYYSDRKHITSSYAPVLVWRIAFVVFYDTIFIIFELIVKR